MHSYGRNVPASYYSSASICRFIVRGSVEGQGGGGGGGGGGGMHLIFVY